MQSGRMAAAAADSCLKHGDLEPTAENLEVYDTLWHQEVAPNVRNRLWMTKLLYLAENDRYDAFMRDLNRMDDETLSKANRGSPIAIAKLLELGDLPLITRLARWELGLGDLN